MGKLIAAREARPSNAGVAIARTTGGITSTVMAAGSAVSAAAVSAAAGCPSLESLSLIGTLFNEIMLLAFPDNLDRAKRNDAGCLVSFQTDSLLVDFEDGAGQLSARE